MATSTFTWMDYRDDDAKRVREALAAFEEKGMIDPLGFGVVRDAFSDLLFPGTSTLHTRPGYLLFVPWIFQRLDRYGGGADGAGTKVRNLEVELIEALLRGSEDKSGIIGRFSRERTKQLPSYAYWSALERFGIRYFEGSQRDYVDAAIKRRSRRDAVPLWNAALPPERPAFLEETTLELTFDEAEFLRTQLITTVGDTYLAHLAQQAGDSAVVVSDEAALPWEHPLASTASLENRTILDHAELFSIASWGAGLLYNLQLSELLVDDGGVGLEEDLDELLERWLDEMDRRQTRFASWDRSAFWATVHRQNPRVRAPTRRFVDTWLDLTTDDPHAVVRDPAVRDLLAHREAALKGARAKLANRRARELSPGAQGDTQMAFRWPQVRDLLIDLDAALVA